MDNGDVRKFREFPFTLFMTMYSIAVPNERDDVSCHAFCLSVDVYLPGYLAEKVVRI